MFTALPFTSVEWTAGGHPLERKKLVGSQPAVLLEFAPDFEDPNWCERAHVVYVLEGTLEFILDDSTVRVPAGCGCVLDRGTRHRAKNAADMPVRLFVVSPGTGPITRP